MRWWIFSLVWILVLALLLPDWTHGNVGYQGQFATRSFINADIDTTNRQMMTRSAHFAESAVSSFKIVICNCAINANGDVVGPGGTTTATAGIEYPQGVCTQVKFSGVASGTVPNIATLTSDDIAVSFPQGAQYWVRMFIVGTVGLADTAGFGSVTDPSLGDATTVAVSGLSDKTIDCTTVTGTAGVDIVTPIAQITSITKPSICVIGDSIAYGVATVTALGDNGVITPSVSTSFGYINMARDGIEALTYSTYLTFFQTIFPYCSHLISQSGLAGIALGDSATTVEGQLTPVYAGFSGTAFQTTLTPETTSTDSWATTANQTVKSFEAQRVQFNSDLRSASFGPNGGYFDMNATLATGTNSSLWNAGASFPQCAPWTTDGVHPDTCGNAYVASGHTIDQSRIHYPYLLNRDIDPASNDNGPVGLNKVA